MRDYTSLYELEADSESMPLALGINKNREEELDLILERALKNHDKISATFVELWEKVEHPNEFAYVTFHYGTRLGASRAMERMLGDFLKK